MTKPYKCFELFNIPNYCEVFKHTQSFVRFLNSNFIANSEHNLQHFMSYAACRNTKVFRIKLIINYINRDRKKTLTNSVLDSLVQIQIA